MRILKKFQYQLTLDKYTTKARGYGPHWRIENNTKKYMGVEFETYLETGLSKVKLTERQGIILDEILNVIGPNVAVIKSDATINGFEAALRPSNPTDIRTRFRRLFDSGLLKELKQIYNRKAGLHVHIPVVTAGDFLPSYFSYNLYNTILNLCLTEGKLRRVFLLRSKPYGAEYQISSYRPVYKTIELRCFNSPVSFDILDRQIEIASIIYKVLKLWQKENKFNPYDYPETCFYRDCGYYDRGDVKRLIPYFKEQLIEEASNDIYTNVRRKFGTKYKEQL